MYVRLKHQPKLPPPVSESGLLGWLRHNLFSSVSNALLTFLGLWLLYLVVPPFLSWAIFDANWSGTSREDCVDAVGACWVFIKVRFPLLMYGFYPEIERWRIDLSALLFLGYAVPLLIAPFLPFSEKTKAVILLLLPLPAIGAAFAAAGPLPGVLALFLLGLPLILPYLGESPLKFCSSLSEKLPSFLPSAPLLSALVSSVLAAAVLNFFALGGEIALGLAVGIFIYCLCGISKPSTAKWQFRFLYLVLPCLCWVILLGGAFALPEVQTDQFGGLFLTIIIALVGMGASLPIGILLALGRTSNMPVIRALCLAFIELARGVPLISVLFMVSVMLPMMLSDGVHFNKLLRALIGVSFFYAAYMAEVVRGGLSAIPKGQQEAAKSLGLRFWPRMRFVILPQALRLTIPAITNTYLGLMKDTTLVAVINLMDILGIIKSALADTRWLGFTKEAYFFAGLIFWILCFIVSRYSLYLERRLNWSIR